MKRSIRPQIYTEPKTLKFTKQQMAAFDKLKSHGINIQHFIREAVKTKIQAEWPEIKQRFINQQTPF
jgi:hypothetical protein